MLWVDAVACLAGVFGLPAFRNVPEHLCHDIDHADAPQLTTLAGYFGRLAGVRDITNPVPTIITLDAIDFGLYLMEPFAGYRFQRRRCLDKGSSFFGESVRMSDHSSQPLRASARCGP